MSSGVDIQRTSPDEEVLENDADLALEEHESHSNRLSPFSLEYITFLVIGASYLWPWNCLLSASAYFRSRLVDHPFLSNNFSPFVMSITSVSQTGFLFYLADRQSDSYIKRLYIGESIIGSVFLFLTLSCAADIPAALYFWFIQACVLCSSLGASLAQNGALALASDLGSSHVQAVMVGQAVAGVVPPCISFLSALSSSEPKTSALATALYFLVASTVCLSAGFLFKTVYSGKAIYADYTPVKTHNSRPDNLDNELEPSTSQNSASNIHDHSAVGHIPLSTLFKRLFAPGFAVFFTFTITLVYPVFASTIDSSSGYRYNLFVPLVFFVWNWGDLTGRLLCMYDSLVIVRPLALIAYAIGRLAMIPLFLLCNIHGRGYIKSDVIYLLLQFFYGVTNGHLASSALMSPPNYVAPHEREAAGGFMTTFLSVGLALGSLLSFGLVKIIEG